MSDGIDLTAWQDKPKDKNGRMTYWNRLRQMARQVSEKNREYAKTLDGPVSIRPKREYKEGEAF